MSKTITHWGRRCKSQMILLDISLKKLAELTGYSPTYISAIINGRMVAPEETIKAINKTLKISA